MFMVKIFYIICIIKLPYIRNTNKLKHGAFFRFYYLYFINQRINQRIKNELK